MGFADFAITIVKNNRQLRRNESIFKSKEFKQELPVKKSSKRRRLSQAALNRVKDKEWENWKRDVIFLIILLAVSAGVINLIFF